MIQKKTERMFSIISTQWGTLKDATCAWQQGPFRALWPKLATPLFKIGVNILVGFYKYTFSALISLEIRIKNNFLFLKCPKILFFLSFEYSNFQKPRPHPAQGKPREEWGSLTRVGKFCQF